MKQVGGVVADYGDGVMQPVECDLRRGQEGFRLTIELDGPIDDKTGFVMDFFDLDNIVNENVINILDHAPKLESE